MNDTLMRNMTETELLNWVDRRDPQVAELAHRLEEHVELIRQLREEVDNGIDAVLDDMK